MLLDMPPMRGNWNFERVNQVKKQAHVSVTAKARSACAYVLLSLLFIRDFLRLPVWC